MVLLKDVIQKPITGEWGSGEGEVKVIRTTNFTNSGILDLSDVVKREIPIEKVKNKKLLFGDIIIEKSGGSPKQPVGRVVFFDKNEEFLCNNFTSILRPKKDKVEPKYLFYLLFANHTFGITGMFQNKTTGIINLQLPRYINKLKISLPSLEVQKQIARQLDDAAALRDKTQQLLDEYDALAQSIFLEMFGDPVVNPMGWEKLPIRKLGRTVTGNTPPRKNKEYYGDFIEWIKTDNINTPNMYLTEAEEFLSEEGLKKGRKVNTGAILVTCIAGSRKVIGNVSIADREVSFNQQINAFEPFNKCSFFWYYHFILAKSYVQNNSTKGMKGIITKGKFEKMFFINPPIQLQKQFSDKIELIEQQKALAKQELQEAEDLFNCLLQRAFKNS
jgi:type I restriction enzyme S subunit